MAIPANVKTLLEARGKAAHQTDMRSSRANRASALNIVLHSVARGVDEMSPTTAAAVAKIMRLPTE